MKDSPVSRQKNTRNVSQSETQIGPHKQGRFRGVSPECFTPYRKGHFETPPETASENDAWAVAVGQHHAALQQGHYRSMLDAAKALALHTGQSLARCRSALRRYVPGHMPRLHITKTPICATCGHTLADAVHDLIVNWPTRKDTPCL